MDTPAARRALLANILRESGAATQAELALALKRRGVRTSQPVLSRDLRALGAVKQDGAYHLADAQRVTPLDSLRPLLRGLRDAGPNLLIIACEPGSASAIARALEAEAIPGMAGTLAGDDTIFIAVEQRKAARAIRDRVGALL